MSGKKKVELNLTEGNIAKVLITFILPIILGSLIQQLYVVADAVIVGQFAGKEGLAAIDSVHTLFKFPINFMNGLAAGATILISGYFGANDHERLECSVRTAYTIALMLGIVCSVLGIFLTPFLLKQMAVPEEIYGMTLQYCYIYFAGLWSIVLYNMTAGVLRAIGDSVRPLYILIGCSIINIFGDYLLVGFFDMGVRGAAIATILAQMVSAGATLYILGKSISSDIGRIRLKPKFCKTHMKKMIYIGFPLALQSIMFPIANSIVQASVNQFGTDQIAAWAVCGKLDMIIWLIADAMSPALTTYIAQNLGAEKRERVRKGALIGTGMSAGAVLCCSMLLYVASPQLALLFVTKKDVALIVPMVVKFMRAMAPFYVFYAIAEAFSGACCGTGDTLKPMLATLICTCVLRIMCVWMILPKYHSMECIIGIYIASWVVTGVAFTIMAIIKNRQDGKNYESIEG